MNNIISVSCINIFYFISYLFKDMQILTKYKRKSLNKKFANFNYLKKLKTDINTILFCYNIYYFIWAKKYNTLANARIKNSQIIIISIYDFL